MVNSNSVVHAESAQPPALPQHVKRALAYLRANMAEKVTLAALAAACGISQRALLTQFERFLGVSPIAHLLRMRLTAARAQLQQSDGTVSISEIASRCGLTHLGRFATEYRRAFGELPSATLRRAAGSVDKSSITVAAHHSCSVSRAATAVANHPAIVYRDDSRATHSTGADGAAGGNHFAHQCCIRDLRRSYLGRPAADCAVSSGVCDCGILPERPPGSA